MNTASNYDSFDHISASIFVLNVGTDGRPTYAAVNAHARSVAGRPLSDYLGRTALEVYPAAYGRAAYARHCEVIMTGQKAAYDLDLPLNGKLRSLRVTLNPVMDAEGRVTQLFGSSIDITAERHAQDARAEFDTMSSEMEEFVAFAAHDLRAPLRNIALLAEILREELGDVPAAPLNILNLIDNVAVKSMDLIADVLSHAQAVSSIKRETVFSFPALCDTISTTLDPQGVHQVKTSLAAIKADRSAVQIALRNLMENAIKHGGRPSLSMEIKAASGLPGMLEITLADNGSGFSDGALKIINGAAFRADSGYGLFGVKRLISARGGTLEARNRPDGGGAVVRFSLPGEMIGPDQLAPAAGQTAEMTQEEREKTSRYSA